MSSCYGEQEDSPLAKRYVPVFSLHARPVSRLSPAVLDAARTVMQTVRREVRESQG